MDVGPAGMELARLGRSAMPVFASLFQPVRELSIRTKQSQTGAILVAVHDSGPGIDPRNLDTGVGMGLSICRPIINSHGGRLSVAPNEPRGAVFQFTLPVAQEDS